jgi:hypothetical protein
MASRRRNADGAGWQSKAFGLSLVGGLTVGNDKSDRALEKFVGPAGALRLSFGLLPETDPRRSLQLAAVEQFMTVLNTFLEGQQNDMRFIALCASNPPTCDPGS